jgi:hypothetical protein
VYRSCHKTLVYHVCSQSFDSAIGQANKHYGVTRPPLAVKAKLMAPDYILANREQRFLATEKEKIGYFTGALRIGVDKLPTKRSIVQVASNPRPIGISWTSFRSSSRPNLCRFQLLWFPFVMSLRMSFLL